MSSSDPQRLLQRFLLKRVIQTISRYEMLRAGDCLGLAVSGGADSTALLRIFAELRSRLGVTLCVLHFHHGLRGAEADADEAFVRQLASSNSLPCIVEKADVASIARRERWNVEDAGRRLRYAFFEKQVASKRVMRIATAHTADDQAETVLARIMRGAGVTGLCAIEPVCGGVIRPLLGLRRTELRAYLTAQGQSWREDETNRDTSRLRARIRQRLMPVLESEFAAGIVERLAGLAELAQEDEALWNALTEERCERLISRPSRYSQGIEIAASDLLAPLGAQFPAKVQQALSHRIVRHLHAKLGAKGQLSRRHVENVTDLAAKANGKKLDLPGMSVSRNAGWLCFEKKRQAGATRYCGAHRKPELSTKT